MELRNISEIHDDKKSIFSVNCCRKEDHVLLQLSGGKKSFEVIIALPSESKSAYIGITGENASITNIKVQQTDKTSDKIDIPRIATKENYTNRLESDIPNIQTVKPLSAFTNGVEIKDKMKLFFHFRNLPDANLVWHCPYVILFYSEDGQVHGKNYQEYAVIKFDGEDNGSNELAENNFTTRKTESFKREASQRSKESNEKIILSKGISS